jgi:hypothetical protein
MSHMWGGDSDGEKFRVDLDLDEEGFQFGRIFSAYLRNRYSVYSNSRDS